MLTCKLAVQWTCWISENAMNTNLHAFNVDSGANKFLHKQHGFTVATCYGAADFHVFLLGLVWGVRRRNKRLAEGQRKGLRCCGCSAKTLWVCAIWVCTEESVMFWLLAFWERISENLWEVWTDSYGNDVHWWCRIQGFMYTAEETSSTTTQWKVYVTAALN